jgi:hypothetical protein
MAEKVPPRHSLAVVLFAMAGTGEIRSSPRNDLNLHVDHKGPQ